MRHRLNALQIKNITKPDDYADGGGLYLQVTPGRDGTLRKSWLYCFELRGRRREMGLGSLAAVSLAQDWPTMRGGCAGRE